ncbi:MAG: SDR family oxidoreductase, partial [Armatimonadetes bacterium]|nr:SDR family oxidoreductase [Armatimonadota bacterium]
MDLGIEGKVALITGAGRGIGLAIAQRLAEEGCRIVAADIDREALDALPGDWLAVTCDVTSEEQVTELFETAVRELGGVDILVNNAGVCIAQTVPETTLENWERTQRINLTSAFMLSRLALPHMNARGWGRIINIASMAGKLGGLTSGIAYTASKAGMMGMT